MSVEQNDHRKSVPQEPLPVLFRDDAALPMPADEPPWEVHLAPPQGLSPAERRAIAAEPIPLSEDPEEERPLHQFSLWELMVLMTFLSAGLAITYYLPAAQVAGVLGLLALVGQGVLMRFPPDNRHIRLTAWLLLIMYAVAALAAFLQHVYGWGAEGFGVWGRG